MDNQSKILFTGIIVCILLIALKVTVFASVFGSNETIPEVTNDEIFDKIESNSSLGQYVLGDSFVNEVSGVKIESGSDLYATNETTGKNLFDKCCNGLIGIGYEDDYTNEHKRRGEYTGIYKNETNKIVFHIFDGEDVEEHTGYNLILTVYRKKI